MSRPVLVAKSLAQIVTFWRPGSEDWGWAEEYADIMARPETKKIRGRVDREGIGFLARVMHRERGKHEYR